MKVSVIVPVYNMEKFVVQALNSVLKQSFQDFELLVYDDGSTDKSVEKIESVKDKRIRLIKGDKNQGAGHAYEVMIKEAVGEYILPFSADDVLDKKFIAAALKGFEENPEVMMVACQPAFIDELGGVYNNPQDARMHIPLCSNRTHVEWISTLRQGNIYFASCMYPKTTFEKCGTFDHDLEWLTDWEFYLRMLQYGTFHIIEEKLCKLRIHGAALSAIGPDKVVRQAKYTRQIRRKYFTPTKQKVYIATPFYMLLAMSPYKRSMVNTFKYLAQQGIECEQLDLDGDSYIDRAKNTLVAKFLESDGTDLIMIDSDMEWHPTAVHRILSFNEDIVAGAFPMKNVWNKFTAWPSVINGQYVGKQLTDGSALMQADLVSGGFIRFKREALERFADHYEDLLYYDGTADPTAPGRIYTCFFECFRQDFNRIGEDIMFSRRWTDMGGELWLDPNITFGHYGTTGTTGNFHQSLMQANKEQQNAK